MDDISAPPRLYARLNSLEEDQCYESEEDWSWNDRIPMESTSSESEYTQEHGDETDETLYENNFVNLPEMEQESSIVHNFRKGQFQF